MSSERAYFRGVGGVFAVKKKNGSSAKPEKAKAAKPGKAAAKPRKAKA